MTGDSHRPPRSGCAINAAIEVLGGPWSMLVLRDVTFGNRRHFRELLHAWKTPCYPQAAFVQSVARMPVGRSSRRGPDSALKHRPADVVPQPLVI
jgi:hypothetical protein